MDCHPAMEPSGLHNCTGSDSSATATADFFLSGFYRLEEAAQKLKAILDDVQARENKLEEAGEEARTMLKDVALRAQRLAVEEGLVRRVKQCLRAEEQVRKDEAEVAERLREVREAEERLESRERGVRAREAAVAKAEREMRAKQRVLREREAAVVELRGLVLGKTIAQDEAVAASIAHSRRILAAERVRLARAWKELRGELSSSPYTPPSVSLPAAPAHPLLLTAPPSHFCLRISGKEGLRERIAARDATMWVGGTPAQLEAVTVTKQEGMELYAELSREGCEVRMVEPWEWGGESSTVLVWNIGAEQYRYTSDSLYALFGTAGVVRAVKVKQRYYTSSRHVVTALVKYSTPLEAARAVEWLDGLPVESLSSSGTFPPLRVHRWGDLLEQDADTKVYQPCNIDSDPAPPSPCVAIYPPPSMDRLHLRKLVGALCSPFQHSLAVGTTPARLQLPTTCSAATIIALLNSLNMSNSLVHFRFAPPSHHPDLTGMWHIHLTYPTTKFDYFLWVHEDADGVALEGRACEGGYTGQGQRLAEGKVDFTIMWEDHPPVTLTLEENTEDSATGVVTLRGSCGIGEVVVNITRPSPPAESSLSPDLASIQSVQEKIDRALEKCDTELIRTLVYNLTYTIREGMKALTSKEADEESCSLSPADDASEETSEARSLSQEPHRPPSPMTEEGRLLTAQNDDDWALPSPPPPPTHHTPPRKLPGQNNPYKSYSFPNGVAVLLCPPPARPREVSNSVFRLGKAGRPVYGSFSGRWVLTLLDDDYIINFDHYAFTGKVIGKVKRIDRAVVKRFSKRGETGWNPGTAPSVLPPRDTFHNAATLQKGLLRALKLFEEAELASGESDPELVDGSIDVSDEGGDDYTCDVRLSLFRAAKTGSVVLRFAIPKYLPVHNLPLNTPCFGVVQQVPSCDSYFKVEGGTPALLQRLTMVEVLGDARRVAWVNHVTTPEGVKAVESKWQRLKPRHSAPQSEQGRVAVREELLPSPEVSPSMPPELERAVAQEVRDFYEAFDEEDDDDDDNDFFISGDPSAEHDMLDVPWAFDRLSKSKADLHRCLARLRGLHRPSAKEDTREEDEVVLMMLSEAYETSGAGRKRKKRRKKKKKKPLTVESRDRAVAEAFLEEMTSPIRIHIPFPVPSEV